MNLENILMQLMQQGRYDDGPSVLEKYRLHQDMLNQRGATTFRNVGPQNLFSFPDRNVQNPYDVQGYRSNQTQNDQVNALQRLLLGGQRI